MAEENILIITDNDLDFSCSKIFLTHEGFTVSRAQNNYTGLRTVFETNPALILMHQKEFKLDGHEFMRKLRERKISSPVIVYAVYDDPVEEFIEAGVHDYIFTEETFELGNIVKKALVFNTNPKYVSMPIVEKLLDRIESQYRENRRLWELYQWYKKNVNGHSCDCQELIDIKKYQEPKSTNLQQVGWMDLGPMMRGDYYVCQECGTRWINWEADGFGGGGGWEKADEIDDLIQSGDITYFEEPEDHKPQ